MDSVKILHAGGYQGVMRYTVLPSDLSEWACTSGQVWGMFALSLYHIRQKNPRNSHLEIECVFDVLKLHLLNNLHPLTHTH